MFAGFEEGVLDGAEIFKLRFFDVLDHIVYLKLKQLVLMLDHRHHLNVSHELSGCYIKRREWFRVFITVQLD